MVSLGWVPTPWTGTVSTSMVSSSAVAGVSLQCNFSVPTFIVLDRPRISMEAQFSPLRTPKKELSRSGNKGFLQSLLHFNDLSQKPKWNVQTSKKKKGKASPWWPLGLTLPQEAMGSQCSDCTSFSSLWQLVAPLLTLQGPAGTTPT